MTAPIADSTGRYGPVIEGRESAGDLILLCDHASNAIPAPWGDLGLTPAQRSAHIAWDPGATGLTRALAARLEAACVLATVSRLVYDCNRAPDMAGAMPARSEVHDIPGNAAITTAERLARTRAVYLPYHDAVHHLIAERIALGRRPAIITVHSFTPVYFGQPREVEFGVIHDADDRLARAVLDEARQGTSLVSALNAPYSAADDVTHTLRLQATPYGLMNAMLEIRNDLLTSAEAEQAMADKLTPVLERAITATGQR